ncbi:MAG TPA: 2-dehydropantoate 2-reductase [Bacillota bacterium]|nr:2-dehydropantoate 2-reductase [Bacillota bacterium]
MKIAVLGAGAMGSIYGGFLSLQHEVWLIDIWQEHVDAINREGLTVEEGDHNHRFYPKAVTSAKKVGPVDLVVVFVKSIDTAQALAQNQELFTPETTVLTLQNGWGNAEDILNYVQAEQLLVGTTSHGGNVLGPGKVRQAGRGQTFLGAYSEGSARAQVIVTALKEAGFTAFVTDNIMEMIWKKLCVNSVINPITALLNVRNGYIVDCGQTLALLENLVREAVMVINTTGITLDPTAMIAEVQKIAGLTQDNRSSMLQDVAKKRKTEIERINGAIVAQGNHTGIATPYHTMMLQLVQALEKTYLPQ